MLQCHQSFDFIFHFLIGPGSGISPVPFTEFPCVSIFLNSHYLPRFPHNTWCHKWHTLQSPDPSSIGQYSGPWCHSNSYDRLTGLLIGVVLVRVSPVIISPPTCVVTKVPGQFSRTYRVWSTRLCRTKLNPSLFNPPITAMHLTLRFTSSDPCVKVYNVMTITLWVFHCWLFFMKPEQGRCIPPGGCTLVRTIRNSTYLLLFACKNIHPNTLQLFSSTFYG